MKTAVAFKKCSWSMSHLEAVYDDGTTEIVVRTQGVEAQHRALVAAEKLAQEAEQATRKRHQKAMVRGGPEVIAYSANGHDEYRHGLVYEKDMTKVANCDLKNKVAEKEWPRYIKGEGPMPFRTTVERREYLKRFDFTEA